MKHLPVIAIILAVIAIFANLGGGGGLQFGASATSSTNSAIDAKAFSVNGTTVIIDSGAWVGIVDGTTGTFSGAITGATTLTMTGDTNVQDLVQGGGVLAYSSAANGIDSITATQICDNSVINWTAATSTDSVSSTTLPSDQTLLADCLTEIGDTKTILFRNTSIAASTTVLIAGDSIDLIFSSTTQATVTVAGSQATLIKFWRIAASTTVAIISLLADAD